MHIEDIHMVIKTSKSVGPEARFGRYSEASSIALLLSDPDNHIWACVKSASNSEEGPWYVEIRDLNRDYDPREIVYATLDWEG